MTVFILCHQDEPYFRPPDGSVILWSNRSKPERHHKNCQYVHAYDFFESPEDIHKQLAGTFGTMAIIEYLKHSRNETGKVTVWQYRKFVLREFFGHEASNSPGMYLVKRTALGDAPIVNPEIEYKTAETDCDGLDGFLVPRPLWIANMAYQYSMFTPMIDFIRFAYLAVERDVISPMECSALCRSEYILGGGIELGTYPASWWVDAATSLVDVALAFSSMFGPSQPDHPYHSRAASFCAERLGSYLLQNQLIKAGGETFMEKVRAAAAYPARPPRWYFDRLFQKGRLARKQAEFKNGTHHPFATMHVVTDEAIYQSLGMQ